MVVEKEQNERSADIPRRVHDWELWEHRYRALDKMIGTLQDEIKCNDNDIEGSAEVSRRQTFCVLLLGLREFAQKQFCFLYNGLDSRHDDGGCLEPSMQYPPDFVLEATLDQIAYDLTVLQGAWYQRVLARGNPAMARTFEVADQLAYYALLPALRYKLLPFDRDKVTVLTYFQKAPHIRMIPYASVALVGIPFTTLATYSDQPIGAEEIPGPCDHDEASKPDPPPVGNARDLLSIPHEIGHYVYRHGVAGRTRLQYALHEALLGQPEWLHNWAEEIFADVYGVLIAGPVIVRDFQDIMKDNDLPALLNGDSKHPTPVLRPLLYVDALKLLAESVADDKMKQLVAEAESRWKNYRGYRGEEHIQERRAVIEKAVTRTFGILTENKAVLADDLWSLPGPAATAAAQFDDLYDRFYESLVTSKKDDDLFERLRAQNERETRGISSQAPSEEGGSVPPELDEEWPTPLQRIPTLQWLEQIRNSLTADCSAKQERIPTEVWTLVVSMNGWATDGPEQSPTPKVI